MYPPILYEEYLKELAELRDEQTKRYYHDDKFKCNPTATASQRFFMTESVWRDDDETLCEGVYCKCFFTFSQLVEYVKGFYASKVEADVDIDWVDEPPENRLWWDCTWNMLREGKCESIQFFALSAIGELISFGSPRAGAPLHKERLFSQHHYFDNPHNVIVPFEPGDILEYDARPFGKPLFVVWGKNGPLTLPGERDSTRGSLERLEYLYRGEDRNGLDIQARGDTDYIYCPYDALDKFRIVDSCDDPMLLRASELLKANPDLWDEWHELQYIHPITEGGLEQWIFGK